MKVFVWEYVNGLTYNYHNGGGVMIIAHDLRTARSFWLSESSSSEWFDPKKCELLEKEPDFVCSVEGQCPRIIEFPDVGCC